MFSRVRKNTHKEHALIRTWWCGRVCLTYSCTVASVTQREDGWSFLLWLSRFPSVLDLKPLPFYDWILESTSCNSYRLSTQITVVSWQNVFRWKMEETSTTTGCVFAVNFVTNYVWFIKHAAAVGCRLHFIRGKKSFLPGCAAVTTVLIDISFMFNNQLFF